MEKTRGRISGLAVAVLTILVSVAVTAVIPTPSAYAVTFDSEEAALCRLVNTYRAQNGLPAVLVSTPLTNAAEWLSTDMAQKNYFSHTDSLGRNPPTRMAAFGYSYTTAKGENIAGGSSTASATFTQWKNSPEHDANMLSSSYVVMGLGRAYQASAQYDWYWTNTFGGYNDGATPCPSPLPALTVNDVSVTEGYSGTKTVRFTVSRSGVTTRGSSVSYATVDGTATATTPALLGDYVARPPTTLTFAAGETAKVVAVTVHGDTAVEPNENFFLKLSSATGATITDSTGAATIQNDDSASTLAVNNVVVTEGNSGTRSATFSVTRTGLLTGTSAVRIATVNGTATAGSDYAAIALTTVTFARGESTRLVAVSVSGDTAVEPNENFFLKLSSATGATITDNTGVATIQNDDTAY